MGNLEAKKRELEHHEELYSGSAQAMFAQPAVRAFRCHLAARILEATGAGRESRVLSLGCGIGDTEILLAPQVGELVGVDLSPAAIRQARFDAAAAGLTNVRFLEGGLDRLDFPPARFDAIVAVFFMHHLDDEDLGLLSARVRELLKPSGAYYGLDPSRYRLSGAVGRLLIPRVMEKHQSPDERQLFPSETAKLFREAGLRTTVRMYDFGSTPCAGLLPGSASAYRLTRVIDDLLVKIPLLNKLGSNFELIAHL